MTVLRRPLSEGSRQLRTLQASAATTTVTAVDTQAAELAVREKLRLAFADELDALRAQTQREAVAELEQRQQEQLKNRLAEIQVEAEQAKKLAEQNYQQKLAVLTQLIERMQTEQSQQLKNAEAQMLTLSFACVSQILGKLAVEKALMEPLVRHALADMDNRSPLRIRLHPAQAQELQSNPRASDWHTLISGDQNLNLGDCLIEFEQHALNASLHAQLSTLKDTLLSVYAQSASESEHAEH